MIVISVDMWPKGDRTKAYHLGQMRIVNVTSNEEPIESRKQVGDYNAKVMRKGSETYSVRDCKIVKHKRLRLPIWSLVAKALVEMGYDKLEG